jgi:AraC family transcriptional regulator
LENAAHIQRIRRILDYIEKSLHEDLNLHSISKEGYYSPYHFHRNFKGIIGETLHDYILRKRMEKSVMLLSKSNFKLLDEIYLEIGFKSHSTFSKSFKKYFGITPTNIRKINPENFSKI